MAEIVVGSVVAVLIEKLLSVDLLNLARSEGIESQLMKLKKNFLLIQAVLADAGQKQVKQKPVELWLLALQDLAYDIDDVLDDMATQVLRRKSNHVSTSTGSGSINLLKLIPACCTSYTPRNMIYGRKISDALDEINTRLNDLVEHKNNLSLKVNLKVERSYKTDVRSHQTSSVKSKVLGREQDKAALLGKLLGDEKESNQNVNIVSIVGMGGLGKTTLAQVLYNEQKIKDHFELMVWMCVSDEFDVFNISKAIYQAVGGEDKQFATLDLLHVALKQKLSNKRFLVVLDDVWNEDHKEWDLLRSAFDVGAHGSRILVTTRKKKVALLMNSSQPYEMEVLSDEIALSLFAQSALDEENFDSNPSLKLIAQGIIKKCKGLPLALVTLGKVLKTKENDDEWEELLNSDIWDLDDESGILPALKLSYYDLPPNLKRLFAYCSLFPKDYEFEKNKLVLLWMAEGFLSQTKGNKPMEILGRKYFEELLSRSFFQPSSNHESRYTMHDLMNDLAISVAGEFFLMWDDKMNINRKNESFEKLRHFSFIGERHAVYRKFKELHKARCLRTFLPMPGGWGLIDALDNVLVQLLPRLQFLRVLSLTHDSISEVPQSIGNLKHLRYLNFSSTRIKYLPEQVSELYNLQSLLVCECRELSTLPISFVKLINLRHLDMTRTPLLKKLPLGIGRLTSLQTLSKVIIEEGNGFNLSELKGLMDIQGQLSIQKLDNVIDPKQAEDASLLQKKGLDDLELQWGSFPLYFDSQNPMIEYDVLERLKPHSKLKKLKISGYGGMKFPSWFWDPSFDQLTDLSLCHSKNVTELPTLRHLTSLRTLLVKNCSKLESIGEKEVNVGSSMMISLREVTISDCDTLKSYSCPNSVERLYIMKCDLMTSLTFSTLQEELQPSSLKILTISHCEKLKSIPHERFQSLTSLGELNIYDCPSMEYSFPCGLWPPNLKCLRIGELNKPMSEWGLQNYPTSLVHLDLYGKNSGVVSFGMEEYHMMNNNTTSSTSFPLPRSLAFLRIRDFIEVESLSQVLQHLPRLEDLYIYFCPKLRDVPGVLSHALTYITM